MPPRTSLAALRPAAPATPDSGCAGTPGTGPEVPAGSGRRTAPLQQHEINEAGYLAACASMSDPIDDPDDLRRLVAGNETLHETRSRLDVGRGNVAADVTASRSSSMYRTLTTHWAKERQDLGGKGEFERKHAAALALRAGNCDHHGTLAAMLHGPRLEEGETVHVVGSDEYRHTWAEIRKPARFPTPDRPGSPRRPSVTMDPWSNGPAMQTADTMWAERRREPDASFDARTGRAAREGLLQLADQFTHGPQAAILARQLKKYEKKRPKVKGDRWRRSTQLAGSRDPERRTPGFGENARTYMGRLKPLHQQVLAVGAARSAYHMTIPAAARQANAIVDAARTLDTMPDALARPPLRNPKTLT